MNFEKSFDDLQKFKRVRRSFKIQPRPIGDNAYHEVSGQLEILTKFIKGDWIYNIKGAGCLAKHAINCITILINNYY